MASSTTLVNFASRYFKFQLLECGRRAVSKTSQSALRVSSDRHSSYQIRSMSSASETNAEDLSQSTNSYNEASSKPLYPGHIPTSNLQKVLLTATSAVASIFNPARDDMISTMGEASGECALKNIHRRMSADPDGRVILEERPIISKETVDLNYLSTLSENTFGKHYYNFLHDNGFDPDSRRPITFVDDVELAYVMLRYRQIHDLTHTILGMKPNMLGEVAVKWFEALQTGLPMCITGAIIGPVRLGPKHRTLYMTSILPWAVQTGLQAKFLMTVYFEKHWDKPIDELRSELNIKPTTHNQLT